MRCVECGHEIKDGAVFCIRCGAMQTSNRASQGQAAGGAAGRSAAPRPVKQFEPTPKRGGGGIHAEDELRRGRKNAEYQDRED